MQRTFTALAACAVAFGATAPCMAIDEAHHQKARDLIDNAIGYLRSQQDDQTGGWSVMPKGRPQIPGITALVVNGMLLEPAIDANDPDVREGIDFMLSFAQDDGGIYDTMLSNYNTAMCLSALAHANTPETTARIKPAQDFLRGVQWSEESIEHNETGKVDEDHPFYGGVGYGGHSRPDNSNLQLMLQGLHDSGLSTEDVAFQRALKFLQRTQMHDDINDMPYANGATQGGFIYATAEEGDAEHMGKGESKAGKAPEPTGDRLQCYGSMTYAGFKSYLYANLDRDDQRVRVAYDWICNNYTLQENPGVGQQGLYYYFVTFSRALDAWGLPTIETTNADGSTEIRDWANDLIDRLAELQEEDGSFRVVHKRWMEDNKTLITAYCLLALEHAIN